jgi:tetratricopeptide (TPR) repeat protein
MSDYSNPLESKTHNLNKQYCRARKKQSDGRFDDALVLWQKLLRQCEYGSIEYVEVLRQIAVCLRLANDLNAAADRFHEAYQLAIQLHAVLAARTMRDWSALWLEQGDYAAADHLQEVLMALPEGSDDWLATLGYHGRVIARLDNLDEAVNELRMARKGLRGKPQWKELRYDFLLWLIELRPAWSVSLPYSLQRAGYVLQAMPGAMRRGYVRMADLAVTSWGGYKLRDKVRRRVGSANLSLDTCRVYVRQVFIYESAVVDI